MPKFGTSWIDQRLSLADRSHREVGGFVLAQDAAVVSVPKGSELWVGAGVSVRRSVGRTFLFTGTSAVEIASDSQSALAKRVQAAR
jgi:hypothetical protein